MYVWTRVIQNTIPNSKSFCDYLERPFSKFIYVFFLNSALSLSPVPPGWLSGERVGLMTCWL